MASVVCNLAAALCLIYGISIMAARTGTAFYIVWYGLSIIFFCLGRAARLQVWQLLPSLIKYILIGGCSLFLVFFLFVEGSIIREFHRRPAENLDYLIVLGAHVTATGPKPVLIYRLQAAGQYLSDHPDTVCILSGGQGANEPVSEAEAMRDYLTGQGIDPSRLLLEDRSLNTHQNLIYSSRLIRPDLDRVGIVTNNFHIFRSIHLAKGVGIRHVNGIAAGSNPHFLPNNLLREFLAVCKDAAAGNLR